MKNIVLSLIVLFCMYRYVYNEARKPVVTCADLNRISYCSSCFNVTTCEFGFDGNTTSCDVETEACLQDEVGSYCAPKPYVPHCECSGPIGTGIQDAYDPKKYFFCMEAGIIVDECDYDQYFNPSLRECQDLYLSTPFAPGVTEMCGEEISYTALTCFKYQECVQGISEVYECENGDIYNNSTNECELYIPFSCSEKQNGDYPDSVRCDLYHNCEGGIEVSSEECLFGMVYDPENGTCTNDQTACNLTGCYVPIPDNVQCRFGNETFQINHDSYYECVPSATGEFEAIPRECGAGSFFDADDGVCKRYADLPKPYHGGEAIANSGSAIEDSPELEPRRPRTSCQDLRKTSYCSSCFNITHCADGFDSYSEGCDVDTQVCFEDTYASFCTDKELVPECQCPVEIGAGKPDFYDPQKYYFCRMEGIVPGECSNSQYFDENSGLCEDIFLSTPFAPQTPSSCENTDLAIYVLDCTRYQECLSGYSQIYECEVGDVISSESNQCQLYIPFTCTGKPDGEYADSVRCDTYHICASGVNVSSKQCGNDTVYDPVNHICTTDVTVCTLNGCFYPIPDYVTCKFGNETYQINHDSYYQCSATTTGSYEPIPQECSAGNYFDPEDSLCKPFPSSYPEKTLLMRRATKVF